LTGFVALCVDGHEDLAGLGFAVGTAEIIFTVGVERAALRIPQELVVDGAVIIDVNLFRPERPRCGDFTEVAPDLVGGGDFLTQRALLGAGTIAAIPPLFLIRFGLGAVSYASQTPGGLFAPMLVLGAQMGLFFGLLFRSVFSDPSIQPEAFAIVGMAAFFCGVVRSPLTGIVLVTEMTGNATMLLPMLGACFAAMLVPTLLHNAPIYDSLRSR
jgi:Voltage gated chloride channel